MDKDQLLERFMPSLVRFNPDFKPEWVNRAWLKKSNYAQPVPLVNHSRNIPPIETPIPGLYFARPGYISSLQATTTYGIAPNSRVSTDRNSIGLYAAKKYVPERIPNGGLKSGGPD